MHLGALFQWLLYTWPKIQQVMSLDIPFPVEGWPAQTDKVLDFQSLERNILQNRMIRGVFQFLEPTFHLFSTRPPV